MDAGVAWLEGRKPFDLGPRFLGRGMTPAIVAEAVLAAADAPMRVVLSTSVALPAYWTALQMVTCAALGAGQDAVVWIAPLLA